MFYKIVIATFTISTIAFPAFAQQSFDRGLVRLAQNKTKDCPSVVVAMPKNKIGRDEINKLDKKKFRWDEACVARTVGSYNESLKGLQARLNSPKCDPQLTRQNVEQWLANYQKSFDEALK